MTIWPTQRKPLRVGNVSTLPHWWATRGVAPTFANGAWSFANRAVFCPIYIDTAIPRAFLSPFFGGTVGNNSWDMGLYRSGDEGRPGELVGSVGGFVSTALAGGETFPARPPLPPIPPGVYFLALVCDGTTDTVICMGAATDHGQVLAAGYYTQDDAYPLPAVADSDLSAVAANIPVLTLVVL